MNYENDRLQEKVADMQVAGWKVDRQQGESVIMTRHDFGSFVAHVVMFLLTGWFTLGFGNLLYAGYRYFLKADKTVVRVE